MKLKVLFICKKRIDSYGISIGLINSAKFVVRSLNAHGIEAKLESVIDNNCINKEVSSYNPTHVFIEAIWVTPEKIKELIILHPNIKWIVRVHSKTPFLGMEGIAMEWLLKYRHIAKHNKNFMIAPNSTSLANDLNDALGFNSIPLLNTYLPEETHNHCHHMKRNDKTMDIGCFGAIRPLKNHLIQALAAIDFSRDHGKRLRFHINANRIEQKGDEVLKNLRALHHAGAMELVEHPWLKHNEFLYLVKTMDIGMQVSLSESFNIVAADFVNMEVPIVVSTDVEWMPWYAKANPTDMKDIVQKMNRSWSLRNMGMLTFNKWALENHNKIAIRGWLGFLKGC